MIQLESNETIIEQCQKPLEVLQCSMSIRIIGEYSRIPGHVVKITTNAVVFRTSTSHLLSVCECDSKLDTSKSPTEMLDFSSKLKTFSRNSPFSAKVCLEVGVLITGQLVLWINDLDARSWILECWMLPQKYSRSQYN